MSEDEPEVSVLRCGLCGGEIGVGTVTFNEVTAWDEVMLPSGYFVVEKLFFTCVGSHRHGGGRSPSC